MLMSLKKLVTIDLEKLVVFIRFRFSNYIRSTRSEQQPYRNVSVPIDTDRLYFR